MIDLLNTRLVKELFLFLFLCFRSLINLFCQDEAESAGAYDQMLATLHKKKRNKKSQGEASEEQFYPENEYNLGLNGSFPHFANTHTPDTHTHTHDTPGRFLSFFFSFWILL